MFHPLYRTKQCIALSLLLATINTSFLSFTEAAENGKVYPSGDDQNDGGPGVSLKKLKQELKKRFPSPRSFVIEPDQDEMHHDGEDIRLLKEFYLNGGKKDQKTTTTSSASPREDVLDVIIVGAGWSGIAAAMTLEAQGITNFKVLEARDTIGGRSRTTSVTVEGEEIPIDLGSMWLIDGEDNPLYEIATTVGNIPMKNSYHYTKIYKDDNAGQFSDEEYSGYYYGPYSEWYAFQAAKQVSVEDKDEPLQVSVDEFFAQGSLTDLTKKITKKLMGQSIDIEYSAPKSQLSMWWWNTPSLDLGSGPDIFLPKGYSSLVKGYAAPIIEKVVTEAVVNKINYKKKNSVSVTYSEPGSQDMVVLKARKVIVTVPLGVLKNKSIQFVPKLPGLRRRAIWRLGMGRINKIFMIWNSEDTFWPEPSTEVEFFSDTNVGSVDFNFYSHGALEGDPRMLFAFFDGDEVATMSDNEVTELAMASLKNMFGDSIKDPVKVYVTKWNTDEYAFGTYSFHKVDLPDIKVRKQLQRPVRQRVFISGEATSTNHYATAHGAYWSGVATAGKVVSSLSARDENVFD
jgi:monoamine oxidase